MHVNHTMKHEPYFQFRIIYLVMFAMDYCDLKLGCLNKLCVEKYEKIGIETLIPSHDEMLVQNRD